MEIKEILEELETFQIAYQLNEMAIYYGTDHGTVKDVQQAFRRLADVQEGMYRTEQYLRIEKPVSQQEINKGLFKQVQKGIYVERKYPIIIVWGEKDKIKGYKKLEGHGLAHILQGHQEDATKCFAELKQKLDITKAKSDKYGNYTIRSGNYRFTFALVDKEDGSPDHAVLITLFKK